MPGCSWEKGTPRYRHHGSSNIPLISLLTGCCSGCSSAITAITRRMLQRDAARLHNTEPVAHWAYTNCMYFLHVTILVFSISRTRAIDLYNLKWFDASIFVH